ncbi:hypothetical protein [Pelagimonas varians]|uniref:hypothetical protein n=1 Tax=Pelagimonas varians TaxID=696760 RepID=UPI000DA1C1A0|nr:hypothetical protein [Pelagimonas varians]
MKKRGLSNLWGKSLADLQDTLVKVPRNIVCAADTDIVIEGFPRSGNTFTIDMLSILQEGSDKRLKIAHHTHVIENILIGRKLDRPIIALIRRPEDAILSYTIFSGKSVEFSAQRYFNFYNAILHMDPVPTIVDFSTVVGDFNKVVELVNTATGASIPLSSDLKADGVRAHALAEGRARGTHGDSYALRIGAPNKDREKVKLERRASIAGFLADHTEVQDLYDRVAAQAI